MKVLILCGVFAAENEKEVIENSKSYVEFSANIFQKKLIDGFNRTECDLYVISAPFIGAYPLRCKKWFFKGFKTAQNKYRYINFINIWGIRNFSRSIAAKKAVKNFIADRDKNKLIVVYSAHTPFLQAAVYAKRKDPSIKICLFSPDLPNYMNLDANRSKIYDFAKKYDISLMHNLMSHVDAFVILTEHMKECLPIYDKPYIVAEGIFSDCAEYETIKKENETDGITRIVYAGKLNEKFGIKNLVDAFSLLTDINYRLILCGTGDCSDYVSNASEKDKRIIYTGQITPEESKNWQMRANVLINPRENNEEYTKYSFPSKNIDYLMTGKPVVAYMLDGIPKIYENFLYVIDENKSPAYAISEAIERAVKENADCGQERFLSFMKYAEEKLSAHKIANSIVKMCFK